MKANGIMDIVQVVGVALACAAIIWWAFTHKDEPHQPPAVKPTVEEEIIMMAPLVVVPLDSVGRDSILRASEEALLEAIRLQDSLARRLKEEAKR